MDKELFSQYLAKLGLNENDQIVYSTLLGKGVMTPGELQQTIVKLELLEVIESLRDLTDLAVVEALGSKIKRYYARLPFLKQILNIERESIFSLNSLVTSIDEKKDYLEERREEISHVHLPMFVSQLLDIYYDMIVKPTRDRVNETKNEMEDQSVAAVRNIQKINEKIKSDITQIGEVALNLIQSISTKKVLKVTEADEKAAEIIQNGKLKQTEILKITHEQLKDNFDEIDSNLKSILEETDEVSIEEYKSVVDSDIKKLSEIEGIASRVDSELKSHNQKVKSGMIKLREEVFNRSINLFDSITDADSKANTIHKFRETLTSIFEEQENFFQTSESEIKSHELVEISQTLISKERKMVDSIEKLKLRKLELAENMKKLTEQSKSDFSKVLNTLNELNDEGLKELKTVVSTFLNRFESSILSLSKESVKSVSELTETSKHLIDENISENSLTLETLYEAPIKLLEEFVKNLSRVSEGEKEKFETQTNSSILDYVTKIQEFTEEIIRLLRERIDFAVTMLEGRNLDLRKIQRLNDELDIQVPVENGVVMGLPAIYASLTDLLLRAKRKVTLITPTFDPELFSIAFSHIRNTSTMQVTIVCQFNEKSYAKQLEIAKEFGRIAIYNYPEKNIYACFRDDEEILFGYTVENEEASAIRSLSYSMVNLFKDRINETVIRLSKRIL